MRKKKQPARQFHIVRLPELDAPAVPTVTAALLPEVDAPPLPTITAATFDVVVEADTSKAAEVLGSAVIHATTLGWSFLIEAPAANFSAIDWTSLSNVATGQGLVGSIASFRL